MLLLWILKRCEEWQTILKVYNCSYEWRAVKWDCRTVKHCTLIAIVLCYSIHKDNHLVFSSFCEYWMLSLHVIVWRQPFNHLTCDLFGNAKILEHKLFYMKNYWAIDSPWCCAWVYSSHDMNKLLYIKKECKNLPTKEEHHRASLTRLRLFVTTLLALASLSHPPSLEDSLGW